VKSLGKGKLLIFIFNGIYLFVALKVLYSCLSVCPSSMSFSFNLTCRGLHNFIMSIVGDICIVKKTEQQLEV